MKFVCSALLCAFGAASQPFPATAWPETRSAKSAEMDRWLRDRGGDHWAAVVIQGGRLIYSGQGHRGSVHQKNDCGSILKPLQGTILGAALQQGRLKSLDEPALPYWREPHTTPWENDRGVTFRQFAQYRDR